MVKIIYDVSVIYYFSSTSLLCVYDMIQKTEFWLLLNRLIFGSVFVLVFVLGVAKQCVFSKDKGKKQKGLDESTRVN